MSIARRELLTVHLPAALWWLAVTVALAAPQRNFADLPHWFPDFLHFQWIDKVVHAVLFGILGLLVARSFRLLPAFRRPLLGAFLATCLYGLAAEVGQEVLTDRSGEVGDWLANVFGAALAIALLALRERRR
ncbi:MAG TPA: VanZ family protein [Thermoanaerobaculia bacterium]|nr:VanZ family protein [Thermoanaerobaculia bacterium]